MKKIFALPSVVETMAGRSAIVFAALCLFLCSPNTLFSQKSITLEDCLVYFKFYSESGPDFHFLKDGVRYVEADGKGLHIRDVRNPDFDSLLTLHLSPEARGYDQYDFSDDETKILFRNKKEQIYRHSVLANYFSASLGLPRRPETSGCLLTKRKAYNEINPPHKTS